MAANIYIPLQQLLHVRSGPGAAILPSTSPLSSHGAQPRLTHVLMRFPFEGVKVLGPHLFWRNHLRRLKFYNPALPVSVEHSRVDQAEQSRKRILQLTFEGTDVQALEAIGGSKAGQVSAALEKRRKEKRMEKERLTRTQVLVEEGGLMTTMGEEGEGKEKKETEEKRLADVDELAKEGALTEEEEKEELTRGQSPNWGDALGEGMKTEDSVNDLEDVEDEEAEEDEEDEEDEMDEEDEVGDEEAKVELEAETETQAEPSGRQMADTDAVDLQDAVNLNDEKVPNNESRLRSKKRADDDVVLKVPQPTAPTTKATDPPALIYTRNVMLNLRGRDATTIWSWFQARTKCISVRPTPEDRREQRQMAEQAKRSEEDRVRVKAGMDTLRSKDVMLKRARAEAEKMRAEL